MDRSPLYDLIRHIEYGTGLHIGVLFFENYGNEQCALPAEHRQHHSAVCDQFKTFGSNAFRRCFKCRGLAIKKALKTKKPFAGHCINGVYEYTHPVAIGSEVAFMIFIGNILEPKEGPRRIARAAKGRPFPIETMERGVSYEDCQSIARRIEDYILFLLEKYPRPNRAGNNVVRNIKDFILSNLEFDITVGGIAALFHYNERYLGRLFKKEAGMTVSDYINAKRIERGCRLLRNTNHTVIDISNEIGFNNVTYFNQVFKKQTGMTPTQYRSVMSIAESPPSILAP